MKKLWKTLASKCIYQASDGIKVHQNILYRWLTLNSDTVQTLINRYYPHFPSLQYIKPLTFALRALPSACCLLGLGGGAVAHATKMYLNDIELTAVESNLDVINTASMYFMTDQIKNLVIIHQDANLFVQQCKINYPHLLIDIYNGHTFPTHCNYLAFFGYCKNIVCDNGFLSINLADINESWIILQYLRHHFGQKTVCIPIKRTSNLIIIVINSSSITPLLDLFEQSNEVKKIIWDVQWGYMAELR